MKKILTVLLTIIFTITIFIYNSKKVILANNLNEVAENNYMVKIVSDKNVDFSKIGIDIFNQVENDPIGMKEYYETYSHSAYFSANGEYHFMGENNNYSVSINIDSLPTNYGVICKNVFLNNYSPIAEFIITEISDIKIDIDNEGNGNAKFFAFNGRELFADYKLEITYSDKTINQYCDKLNYTAKLQVSGEKYIINNSKDISKLSDFEKEEIVSKIKKTNCLITKPKNQLLSEEKITNEDELPFIKIGRFKVSYTPSENQIINDRTMILARQIANNMIEAENYFVNVLGFQQAVDTSKEVPNEYNITLNIYNDETINELTCNVLNSRTDNQDYDMIDEIHFFYYTYITIDLRYNLNNSDIIGSYFNEFLKEVCAHEYFHAIMKMRGIDSVFISESLSSFMDLYYCDAYLKLKNSLIKSAVTKRVMNYTVGQNGTITDSSYINSNYELIPPTTNDRNYEYGSMLFVAFLYEKFGTFDFIKQLIYNFDINNLYYTYEYVPTLYGTTLSALLEEYQIYRKFPNLYVTSIDNYYTEDWKMLITENKITIDNIGNDKKLNKYSARYIMFTGKSVVANDSIYLTISLNQPLSESFAIYTVKKKGNLAPIVKKISTNESRITIRVDAVDLKADEELVVIFMNLSNKDINNWIDYSVSTQKNSAKHSLSLIDSEEEVELNISEYSSFISLDVLYVGWYQIELIFNENIQQLPKNTIELYDYNNNIVEKCKYIDDEARSKDNEKSMFVYLDSTRDASMNVKNPYRLRVGYMYSNINCTLKIKRIRGQVPTFGNSSLSKTVLLSNMSGDETNYVKTALIGSLFITLTIPNIDDNESQQVLIIKKLKTEAFIEYCDIKTLTSLNSTIQLSYDTNIYEDFIIVILNGKNTMTINYNMDVKHDFDIILDPEDRDPAYLGTEVRLNGGLNNGNTITKGFTRCAYLGLNAPTLSRLDYVWTSSNDTIATVSSYGTILAIKPGIAVITATNSTGESSYVVVEVFEDERHDIVNFEISTDQGTDTGVGTYVKQGLGLPGGTELMCGYTRIISLMSDAPSTILQNYNWTSSDSSIAYVSSYGTIIGKGAGTVTITGVYKYNARYVTTITIVVR